MAEVLLRHWGRDRFRSFSAGCDPAPVPHSLALHVIERAHQPIDDLAPKSWHSFAHEDAPTMDFVITLCPVIAAIPSPKWRGRPMTAHWGIGDPALALGMKREQLRTFDRAYREIESRVKLFVNLPLGSLDRVTLNAELQRLE